MAAEQGHRVITSEQCRGDVQHVFVDEPSLVEISRHTRPTFHHQINDAPAPQFVENIHQLALEFPARVYGCPLRCGTENYALRVPPLDMANRQRRVICSHRPRTNKNPITASAQTVRIQPGFVTGNPLGASIGRCSTSIKCRCQFEHYPRTTRPPLMEVGIQLFANCLLAYPDDNLETRVTQTSDALATYQRIRISDSDQYPGDTRFDDRLGTRTGSSGVTTWL